MVKFITRAKKVRLKLFPYWRGTDERGAALVSKGLDAKPRNTCGRSEILNHSIYMPMSPQAIYAMQACARIGAIHSVIFGGFSPSAIADRINDSGAKVVITSDEGRRAGNCVPLKANVDEAVLQDSVTTVEHVVVHKLTSGDVDWHDHDIWWHDLVADQAPDCQAMYAPACSGN